MISLCICQRKLIITEINAAHKIVRHKLRMDLKKAVIPSSVAFVLFTSFIRIKLFSAHFQPLTDTLYLYVGGEEVTQGQCFSFV